MEKYNNPLTPSKDLIPSGRNSLDGALKNGTRALNSPDSESRITETSHDVEANNGQEIQDMQNQIDQLQRSVTLIFWYQANTDPIRLQHTIPTFPLFQLSRFSSLTTDLGLSPTSYLDTYNPQSEQWEQHTISSVRVVESKQRLLYKLRKSLFQGLSEDECLGLKAEVSMQVAPSSNEDATSGPVKSTLKRPAFAPLESTPPTKLHIREAAVPSMSAVATPSSPVPAPAPTAYMYQNPSFFPGSTNGVLAIPSHLLLPHSPTAPIPYHPHPPLKRWPNDYTVAELSVGFHAMDSLVSQSPNGATMTQRTAFERVFGSRYVKSTVCRHRGVWRKAQQAIREEFERMGSDERACWGEFVRRVEGRPPGRASMTVAAGSGGSIGTSTGIVPVQGEAQPSNAQHVTASEAEGGQSGLTSIAMVDRSVSENRDEGPSAADFQTEHMAMTPQDNVPSASASQDGNDTMNGNVYDPALSTSD